MKKFTLVLRPNTGNDDEEGNSNNEVARIIIECDELPRVGDNLVIREPMTIIASNGKTVVVNGGIDDGRLDCKVTQRYRSVANNVLDTKDSGNEDGWPDNIEIEADMNGLYHAIQLMAAINPEVIWSEKKNPGHRMIPYEVFTKKAKLAGLPVNIIGSNIVEERDSVKVRFADKTEQLVPWKDLKLTEVDNPHHLRLNGF